MRRAQITVGRCRSSCVVEPIKKAHSLRAETPLLLLGIVVAPLVVACSSNAMLPASADLVLLPSSPHAAANEHATERGSRKGPVSWLSVRFEGNGSQG